MRPISSSNPLLQIQAVNDDDNKCYSQPFQIDKRILIRDEEGRCHTYIDLCVSLANGLIATSVVSGVRCKVLSSIFT